uniref:Uncharacterized protein n=1 Tax=Anopheles atroparvus TaxID=41427 RepID=A0A182J818_ANOAO
MKLQDNNFYFAQSQGRFVPSFDNPRNGFFPSALQRQQAPPDSYQEQTLFVNSNNVDRGTGASEGAGSRGITPSYYQFTYTSGQRCLRLGQFSTAQTSAQKAERRTTL